MGLCGLRATHGIRGRPPPTSLSLPTIPSIPSIACTQTSWESVPKRRMWKIKALVVMHPTLRQIQSPAGVRMPLPLGATTMTTLATMTHNWMRVR